MICFKVLVKINNPNGKVCLYSKKYGKSKEDKEFYYRLPNHLMVWKNVHAKRVLFPNQNFGEDDLWAKRMNAYNRNEIQIDSVLYTYNFNPKISATLGR